MKFWTHVCATLLLTVLALEAAEQITIVKPGEVRLVPIAISGYSGEAERVLKFDLEIAGFVVKPESEAQYILTGKSDGAQVEGRLTDRLSKANLLAKAYTGGTTRSQAHSLADDIVAQVLQQVPIARTKIAFKSEQTQGKSEIFISDYDGHNAIPITQDDSIAAAPAWVPKHWHLFYTSYRSGYAWL